MSRRSPDILRQHAPPVCTAAPTPVRCPDWHTPAGERHVYGCERERYPWCGWGAHSRLLACGHLLDRLTLAEVKRCGAAPMFLPEAVWGPLLAGQRVPFVPGQ